MQSSDSTVRKKGRLKHVAALCHSCDYDERSGNAGLAGRHRAIEPGKFADIVAISANPIADITEFKRVRFVMKGGQVIRNDFMEQVLSNESGGGFK